MPIHSCQKDNKPGYQWGKSGKCYTYDKGDKESKKRALKKAKAQEKAIYASGYKEEIADELGQIVDNRILHFITEKSKE